VPDFSTAGRRPAPWDGALAVLGLVAAVASAYAASSALAGLRQAQRAASETRRELAELAPRNQALVRRLEQAGAGAFARAALTLEAPPRRVLGELTRVLPEDVRLLDLVLSYEERLQLEALVEARSPAAYDRFLERLAASPAFEAVVPGPEAREGQLRVSVRMAYRGAARP
jgi:hypothetical protein